MYVWTSSNTSVATVSTKGIVVTAGLVGYTQVRAADMRNLANFGTAEVGLNYNTSLHFTGTCTYDNCDNSVGVFRK